eukprot:CAMPEP_0119497842 /NCGR_PEP_ID=MMETSP1344-20130328/20769_1 /TAXON_ID=236787 /ORGANISM="Florenciella parvula, Strain CCMP2471" /LENGTH=162 /DNA_ID=CAMNT_0007533665 /DNA_START=268 /DNA_END=753 /DNA_ORIENTATION=-
MSSRSRATDWPPTKPVYRGSPYASSGRPRPSASNLPEVRMSMTQGAEGQSQGGGGSRRRSNSGSGSGSGSGSSSANLDGSQAVGRRELVGGEAGGGGSEVPAGGIAPLEMPERPVHGRPRSSGKRNSNAGLETRRRLVNANDDSLGSATGAGAGGPIGATAT